MTEYITIETDFTEDPDVLDIHTNQHLTLDEKEVYSDVNEGQEGSPLAQMLFEIEGIAALTIIGQDLLVTRQPGYEWHTLIDEISTGLKDFFL